MAKAAIVRTRDSRLQCFFHAADTGVCVRIHENGAWGKPRVLLQGAREVFSVNMAEDGRLYVFAQDERGNMHLCTSSAEASDEWNDQTILRSQMSTAQGTCFHALISDVGLHLVYNMPTGEGRGQQMVSQRLGVNGGWEAANRLGGVMPVGGQLFQTQMAGSRHMLLFYQSCNPDCALGYREIAPDRIGEMHILHTTGYQITDASFVTLPDALHALYIVKSSFSSQLIYRRRDGAGLSDPVVIWEAQRAESCLLFFSEGRLTACCLSNGQVFSCMAKENGTFSWPTRVRMSFATEPMKAVYLSALAESAASTGSFFCREVYVDKARPWEMQLPGVPRGDFFPLDIQLDLPSAHAERAYAAPKADAERPYTAAENQKRVTVQTAEAAEKPFVPQEQVTEMLMSMRVRLEKAVRENAEKDMRIAYLTKRLRESEQERMEMAAEETEPEVESTEEAERETEDE